MKSKKNDIVIVDEVESVAIVPVESKEELTGTDKQPTSLAEMFDRYQKKLYLIDVSGSMTDGMAPEDAVSSYDWTPESIMKFREYVKEQFIAEMIAQDLGEMTKAEAADEAQEAMEDLGLMDDDNLKAHVVQTHLDQTAGIKLTRNYKNKTERKIDAVRGAMENFVERRFDQYEDAQIGLFTFDSGTQVKVHPGATKNEVITAIRALESSHGGTNITQAVDRAIREFRRRKGMAHHIILVTDGEDSGASELQYRVADMKELNIVFDFIYVRGQSEESYHSSYFAKVVEILKKVCSDTGGEYNEVSKASDFAKKFLEVSNRRALPPARS